MVIYFTSFSFGQSNAQIVNTSNQIAGVNHLVNPDLIFPRQNLLLPIPGLSYPVYYDVVKGDCLWFISKRINQGEFNPLPQKVDPIIENQTSPVKEQMFPNWLIWILILLVLAILTWLFIRAGRNWKNSDPITAGTPQVPGGVNDAGAHERLRQIVGNRYPGARLVIRNIRRSNLTGIFRVMYASAPRWWKFLHGNKPYSRMINVNNVAGYAGEVTINGREETIYFLQGCGNDTAESYMVSEANPVNINPDGTEQLIDSNPATEVSSEPAAKPEIQNPVLKKEEKISAEEPVVVKEEKVEAGKPKSELFLVASDHNMLTDELFRTQNVHRVTTKITTSEGTVETTWETKNVDKFQPTKKPTKKGKPNNGLSLN